MAADVKRIEPEPDDAAREAILAALAQPTVPAAGGWADAALRGAVSDREPAPLNEHDVRSLW
jgi:hypothetical protein